MYPRKVTIFRKRTGHLSINYDEHVWQTGTSTVIGKECVALVTSPTEDFTTYSICTLVFYYFFFVTGTVLVSFLF